MNHNKRNYSIPSPFPMGERIGVRLLFFLAVVLFSFCLCFFSSCTGEDTQPDGDGTVVGFILPGIEAGVGEDVSTRATLDKDVKVRVVVYKTGAQSNANYVATKDYTVQANGTLTATDGTDLRLIDDTYDFYAITPDLTVTTSGSTPTVSVAQEKDFAVSLTTNQKISKWSAGEGSAVKRAITLTQLARKCAKVNFAIDIAEDVASTISDTKITEAVLTSMPAPLTASGTTLNAGSGSATLTFPSTMFTTDTDNSRKSSGSTVLLPKTSGAFTLSMKAQFNGVTSVTTQFPAATVPAMTLDGGKEYTFTVRLTKDKLGNTVAGLWVSVSKWNTNSQDINLGGVPTGPVYTQLIGEWTTVMWDNVNLGGVPTGPIITGVSGWWNNIYYNPHLGSSDPGSND